MLQEEYEKNPTWSKVTMLEVAQKTGLSEAQVYKWGWDQKRKKFGADYIPEDHNLHFQHLQGEEETDHEEDELLLLSQHSRHLKPRKAHEMK